MAKLMTVRRNKAGQFSKTGKTKDRIRVGAKKKTGTKKRGKR